jgi:murein DD-endopeptidase MepM/ murein hydrolase activator NlpD
MNQLSHHTTSSKLNRTRLLFVLPLLVLFSLLLCYTLYHLIKSEHSEYTVQSLTLPPDTPVEHHAKPVNTVLKKEIKETNEWQYVRVRPGDTLSSIFKRAGLSSKTLQEVLNKNKYAKQLTRIKPGQEIQILAEDDHLSKMIVPYSKLESLVIERSHQQLISRIEQQPTHTEDKLITATVQGTLYTTAKRHNIPFKLIQQMSSIFNREIDFAKDIRSGDQFTILYRAHYVENELINTGDILAVTYTNKGHTFQAIRYESNDTEGDYFSPDGRSLKQAFSRYPVQFSRISSMFSLSRMHPILHYRRPHQGVDLAAPTGTPVHATGDGRIETIEHHSTYGNVIKISHQNAYSSVYAHMHHFQKGLSRGSRVKRGQIIGYVGQTGLAEGPHCHYEFRINDLPINPSTVVLPRAAAVPKHHLRKFKETAKNRLSQIKLFEQSKLAHTQSQKKKKSA